MIVSALIYRERPAAGDAEGLLVPAVTRAVEVR